MDGGGRIWDQGTKISLGVTTVATDIAAVKNTGTRNSFKNIKFLNNNTKAESLYCFIDAAEGTIMENCSVEHLKLLSTAGVGEFLCQGNLCLYKHCSFGADSVVSSARASILFDAAVGGLSVANHVRFEDCEINGWSTVNTRTLITVTAVTDIKNLVLFKDCVFNANTSEGAASLLKAVTQTGGNFTQGTILMKNCALNKIAAYVTGGDTGVFVEGPATTNAAGKSVQAA